MEMITGKRMGYREGDKKEKEGEKGVEGRKKGGSDKEGR